MTKEEIHRKVLEEWEKLWGSEEAKYRNFIKYWNSRTKEQIRGMFGELIDLTLRLSETRQEKENKKPRVLVACEFSGIVREAFKKKGWDAWSCDLLPTEIPGQHIQGDVLEHLNDGWDLMIAHPPCTHLSVSGARWFTEGRKDRKLQNEALEFVKKLMDAPIEKICIENPVGIISTKIRKPDQIIHPWQFGHTSEKTTCLWLKNLPLLKSTDIKQPEFVIMKNGKRMNKFHYDTFRLPKSKRGHIRSITFQGIADAMAEQWTPKEQEKTDFMSVHLAECNRKKEYCLCDLENATGLSLNG